MRYVLDTLTNVAHLRADDIAIVDDHGTTTYGELTRRVCRLAGLLRTSGCRRIALAADNGADWIVADLAAWVAGATIVPVPPYFTPTQVAHLLDTADVDTIIAEATMPGCAALVDGCEMLDNDSVALQIAIRPGRILVGDHIAPGPAKITFTSGSTGTPKGVLLDCNTIDSVARRLATGLDDIHAPRHLCTTPLATLLENIAGVYVPLTRGATIVVPSLGRLGLYGSSRIDAERFTGMIRSCRASSLILQPQTLRELTRAIASGACPRLTSLAFVAVGGARVDDADLQQARDAGIPAFQGYGLSECASVVALNRPGASRPGSVGRPLPGIAVRIAADGEIFVGGQAMRGYIGDDPVGAGEIATGDVGHLDDDGYLYVTGRKKDVFITSFGRNVSPEWPEAALLHEPEIAQASVFGEAMPFNTAVILPAAGATRAAVDRAIARANARLPDYARITEWVRAEGAIVRLQAAALLPDRPITGGDL